jgi:hypothetical protein
LFACEKFFVFENGIMSDITMDKKYFKPVSKSIKINAHPLLVWEIISKRGNLELCHPFCQSNPVEKWPGKDSVDWVKYYNGLEFKRVFTNWIDGIGYDLLIGKKDGKQSKVVWRILNYDNSLSELNITIYPHNLNKYPNFVKSLAYIFYIKPMLLKYLSSVLSGFSFYITNGLPVEKNQFGKHRWFSN